MPGTQFDTALGLIQGQLAPTQAPSEDITTSGHAELELADGRWLRMTGSATSEGGSIIFLSDFTAIKEREESLRRAKREAEAANASKTRFLANMSHELRTPLNAIMGFSEVMMDQHLGPLDNPRYLAYSGDIHSSGRYLLGIINDILDLSKIEAGKMSLENAEEFPLARALEGSLSICRNLGEKFGVRIESRLPPEGVHLLAVERMIRQILINLVGNAIKFTPAGGCVTIGGDFLPGGGYALTVRDSGIGMTEAEIHKALTPFGQVENKMTATHNGTGLGLPLAKAMLELHDGTLDITSAPGRGTCLTLNFPRERVSIGRRVAAA
jgi:two-component system cell cycle sensor histidine kinase PleC